jgi:hypothetical protein
MNKEVICDSILEFEAAITAGDIPVIGGDLRVSVSSDCKIICRTGKPHLVARDSSQPHVEARESSQPHVEARDSSQPHVEAWGSSQPHVEAWGSSQPHLVARDSSQPHVEARESSQPHVDARDSSQPHVVARGSSQPHLVARESSQPHVEATGNCQISARGKVTIRASAMVAVLAMGSLPEVDGAGYVSYVDLSTPAAWCEYYGVDRDSDGTVVLFKALDGEFRSNRGFYYVPGTTPSAPDWDGGEQECGGGLHFSPSPMHAVAFFTGATKFVGCRLKLDEIVVHPDGVYPEKVKAPRCLEVFQVDRSGKRVPEASR